MPPTEAYRDQATACALIAQKSLDRSDKALWLFMAEAWLGLATDAAKLRQVKSPADRIPGEMA
jgi:hypothetical protein